MANRNKTSTGCLETLGKKCPSESVSISEVIQIINNTKKDFLGIFKNKSSDKLNKSNVPVINNKGSNDRTNNNQLNNTDYQYRGTKTNTKEGKDFLDQTDHVLSKINNSNTDNYSLNRAGRIQGLRTRLILKYLMLDYEYYNYKDHNYE